MKQGLVKVDENSDICSKSRRMN
jgi:hypothetical protein